MMSRLAFMFAIVLMAAAPCAWAQEAPASPRTLYEGGKYQEAYDAVSQAEAPPPTDIFVAAQALLKLDQRDQAREMYRRLDTGNAEDPWTLIARSAVAVIDNNMPAAVENARQATDIAPQNFHAFYQLGLVQTARGEFSAAAISLEKATELDPNDAYAHYYAGMVYNKVRRVDRMTKHFQAFVKLAPDAPERPQVEAILRTLKF
jgi:tetratricopeptide (TPR) repeat protein